MNFKENLHFLMDSRGVQIKELSARTGISENTLKSYLKEASAEPKLGKALAIARALGVSVELLADGKNAPDDTAPPELAEIQRLIRHFPQNELRLVLALARAIQSNETHTIDKT